MNLTAVLTGVGPSIGVLAIFVYVMRSVVRADRRERQAMADFDRRQAAAAAALNQSHNEPNSDAPTA